MLCKVQNIQNIRMNVERFVFGVMRGDIMEYVGEMYDESSWYGGDVGTAMGGSRSSKNKIKLKGTRSIGRCKMGGLKKCVR